MRVTALFAVICVLTLGYAVETEYNADAVEERVQSLEAEVSELRALAKSLMRSSSIADPNAERSEPSAARARRLQTYNGSTPSLTFKVRRVPP